MLVKKVMKGIKREISMSRIFDKATGNYIHSLTNLVKFLRNMKPIEIDLIRRHSASLVFSYYRFPFFSFLFYFFFCFCGDKPKTNGISIYTLVGGTVRRTDNRLKAVELWHSQSSQHYVFTRLKRRCRQKERFL